LGIGDTEDSFELQRCVLPSDLSVKKIVTGGSHSLLLTVDGRIFGTGTNTSGELGEMKNTVEFREIILVDFLPVDVCAEHGFSVILDTSGRVKVLGDFLGSLNESDIIFINETRFQSIAAGPKSIALVYGDCRKLFYIRTSGEKGKHFSFECKIEQVALSFYNCAILLATNHLWLMGKDKWGLLMGRSKEIEHSILMEEWGVVKEIKAGWHHFVFVTERDGKFNIWAFGRNDYYQYSIVKHGQYSDTPVAIMQSLEGRPEIFCGAEHSLFLSDGNAYVCGWNEHGNCCKNPKNFPSVEQLNLFATNATTIGGGWSSTFVEIN